MIKSWCLLFEIKAASIMMRLFFFFTTDFYCQKGNAIIKLRFHLYLFRDVTLLYSSNIFCLLIQELFFSVIWSNLFIFLSFIKLCFT